MADLGAVLEQLKKERAQLDRAITALGPVVRISSGSLPSNGRGRRKSMGGVQSKESRLDSGETAK